MDLQPLIDLIPHETSWDWISELAQLPERIHFASREVVPSFQSPPLNKPWQEVDGMTNQWTTNCCNLLEPPNVAVRVYNQDENVNLRSEIIEPLTAASKGTAVVVYDQPIFESYKCFTQSTLGLAMVSQNDLTYGTPVEFATSAPVMNNLFNVDASTASTQSSVINLSREVYNNGIYRSDSANGLPAEFATPAVLSDPGMNYVFDIEASGVSSNCDKIYGAPGASKSSVIDLSWEVSDNGIYRSDSANGLPVEFATPALLSDRDMNYVFDIEASGVSSNCDKIYGAPGASKSSVIDLSWEVSDNGIYRSDSAYGASVEFATPALLSDSDLNYVFDIEASGVSSQCDKIYGAPGASKSSVIDLSWEVSDNGIYRNDSAYGASVEFATPAAQPAPAAASDVCGEIYGAPVPLQSFVIDTERLVSSSDLEIEIHQNDLAHEASVGTAASVVDSSIGRKRKPKQKKEEKMKMILDKKRNKHTVKEPCKCKKNCSEKVSFEQRNIINKRFWELDYISQKLYIRSKTTIPAATTTARNTVKYFLTTGSDRNVEVCQLFFLATLGFKPNNNTVVRDALKNEFPRPDGRGKNGNKWKFDESVVIEHILSFHPETSHHRREHAPFRKYLPSDVTITKMHQLFTEQDSNTMSCSYDYYRKVVDKLNISFTKLGHEKCEKCEIYLQHSHTSPICQECIDHEKHKQFYIDARTEYESDKLIPDDPQNIIASVDMEKVVMLPRMEQFKEVLFTRRACVFNETFAPIGGSATFPVFASVWHEGIAGRKKEDLISCFRSFLIYHRNSTTITFWSDNCTSQNKCWALFCFMVYIINSDEVAAESITMKFLEKGHTFMSADSFHHQVELAMKHSDKGNVCDFNDFVKCVQSCNGQRVVCKEMSVSDFADWPDWTSTTKINKATPRPYISNISKIKFVRGKKTMLYANSFKDEWIELDFIMAKHQGLVPPEMRNVASGISREVKEGITRKLAPLMPMNRRTFWYEIPTKDQSK